VNFALRSARAKIIIPWWCNAGFLCWRGQRVVVVTDRPTDCSMQKCVCVREAGLFRMGTAAMLSSGRVAIEVRALIILPVCPAAYLNKNKKRGKKCHHRRASPYFLPRLCHMRQKNRLWGERSARGCKTFRGELIH
jgi:hypothetical protein